MTLRKRAVKSFNKLDVGVSYKLLDHDKYSDIRNVYNNKKVQETRHGLAVYNDTSLSGEILSLSFFQRSDSTRYRLAKSGTSLYSVPATGASTAIKTGLTATTKHRAITLTDRHIIAIENDGLYSYDGTTFSPLGQSPPTGASAAVASGGSLTDANNFKVGLTFYASGTGFETNVFESSQVTTANPNKKIEVTDIPTTADNGTIDKVRVYLKNTTSNTEYLFIEEIDLGTATYTISANATSTLTPPTKNAPPIEGGGKYLALFGKKIVYAGNSIFPNDVFFSEEYLPDAFDGTTSQNVLQVPGQGPITAIATGLYDNQYLNPFLIIFKKNSCAVYSELNGIQIQTVIDPHIGCVSHDTIRVRNGVVYFMSENGWYGISNGALIRDNSGRAVSLGNGDIDDIFSRTGWTYEVNAQNFPNFFSAYYSINGHYLTFVSEGASSQITKAYVYEESVGGFRVFDFKYALNCACEGEDDSGYQAIYLGDDTGTIYTYSARNSKYDETPNGGQLSIPTFAIFSYIQPGEDSNSYNFRYLTVRALGSENPIDVKAYPSFNFKVSEDLEYNFPNSTLGFTLDVSQLDIDILDDDRVPVTAMADLSLTGEALLIGFYQDILGANIGLISAQIALNKNGNLNL